MNLLHGRSTVSVLLLISCSIADPDWKAPQGDEFTSRRREICREYFSRNVSAPHLDTSVIEEICRRPLLLIHGFHGSGTSWVASILQQKSATLTRPSDRDWEVIGFSPPGCQKHIGRGWDPVRTPRSCTGAPMDEGELLQNLWPHFTMRLSNPAKWCPSCIASAPASLLHASSASNLSCIYNCPDLELSFSSQFPEAASKWATFWQRSHFFGDCDYCRGVDGASNSAGKKEASACSCQTTADRASPNSISPVEVIFREWSYFWGRRKETSNHRNVVLMSKTPDLSPGLMLRLLPGATIVLGVIRHPYFIMRCGLGNRGHSVAASPFYVHEAHSCVELWSRTLKAFRSRLDSDHFQSPYALVRYEDAVGHGAEHWLASCVLDALLIRGRESAEVPRRALWGMHGEGDSSTTGGSSPWKHKDATFSHRDVCPSDRNGECVSYLRAVESDITKEYGYHLFFNSSASWSQWRLQPRLLRPVRGAPTIGSSPSGAPATPLMKRVACPSA